MRVGVYVNNVVQVPMVMGRSLPEAEQILGQAGLKMDGDKGGNGDGGNGGDKERRRFSLVIQQDPSPGEYVKRGSTVKVRSIP
jgi:serine/threonine-protein kinase